MAIFDDIRLDRTSTAEQIAQALTDKIFSGELAAGEPLRESAIATALGVSRNTVREAMRLLEQSSYVTYEFNRGAVVTDPSHVEVQELYRARRILEVAAASAGALTGEGISGLNDAFDALVRAASEGDAREIVARDLGFHSALVALLGSARIDRYYAQLVQELRFCLLVLQASERKYEHPEAVIEEHRVILEALLASDREVAARLIADHIDGNARRVEHALQRRQD